jgi:DNA-binding CsgD family transcriptional regulator
LVADYLARFGDAAAKADDLRGLRQSLVEELRAIVGCEIAYWGESDSAAPPDAFAALAENKHTSEAIDRFAHNRLRYDVQSARRVARRMGGLVLEEEVIPRSATDRLPLYSEFLRPAGIGLWLYAELSFRGGPSSVILLSRPASEQSVGLRERTKMQELMAPLALVEAAFCASEPMSQAALARSLDGLSPRESEVARLIARGLQNKEIAGLLGISVDTVRKQSMRIYAKTGAWGRAQLAARIAGHDGWSGASGGALSPREAHVARLIASGLRNGEIAALLGVSVDTVRKQSIRVYEKAGVSGRVELAAYLANK